jgi:hypothetical protein
MENINIFLDLEETVIDDFYSKKILFDNIIKIKKSISFFSDKYSNQIDNKNINLILFSAAVCSTNDVEYFNIYLKNILEKHLDLIFSDIFIFDTLTIFKLALKNGINPLPDDTIHDIFQFNIKEQVFELVSKDNSVNILYDDTVLNKHSIIFQDDFSTIKQINITVKV